MDNSQENRREPVSEKGEKYDQTSLDHLTDLISFHTGEGIYLYISPSCKSLLGYDIHNFIGQSAEVLCHPEDCDLIRQFYDKLKKQWNINSITYRMRHHGGHYIWLETSAKVIPNQETGEIEEIFCLTREVTQQKRNQEQFKSHQQPHTFILDNLPDLVTTHTPEGIYQYVSQVSHQLLGYYPQELISRSIASFCHPQDQPLIKQFYQELQQKKSLATVTYRMSHKDGHYLWIETIGKGIIHPQTGDIKEILATSRDITKRKQIEEALIQAERQYYKIFEKSNQGIFKLSSDGYFLDVNAALAQLYGYDSPQELLDKIHDRANQFYVEAQNQDSILNSLRTDGEILNFHSQIYCKQGEMIEIEETIWAIYDQYGDVLYYQGTAHKIENNLQKEEELANNNLRDRVTYLPNRQWFYQQLETILLENHSHSLAVILIHLDNLHLLHESLNITQDDDLIIQITKRLQNKLRTEDILARLGEDEFILLVQNQSAREIILIAKRILNIIHFPFEINNNQVFVRGYIGINFNKINYQKPEIMVRDAQLAMYRAKTQGKENYAIFNPKIKADALTRIQLETDLRQAIKNQKLSLSYQPIVELNTGYLRGFEALVRWQHPVKGNISPVEFIPIAEETGLINSLGWWVLEQACYQLQTWQNLNTKAGQLVINVNVSAQQLKQEKWDDRLNQLLESTGIEGSQLKLEITETCLLETAQNENQRVKQLKNLGLGLCIDDFGTGYSSLSRLHEFPIDTLKIDRSFISQLGISDKSIVPMIINLAHTLGMNVVAEGIETREQFNQLQGLNCELGQGFFFAKPMTNEQATHWVMQDIKSRHEFGVGR
ncbi:GGDEF domain-containing phosphodiesterase [Cyanothece sp. BG0011]|uniref:GGDEF domain-containing phosphodiesterase n=1 Tax=Cyanothece sp. BG0011 TaxID=2082950 RepID=UPI000D1DCE4B|nr:GGDEF domain-containing phosphodiesterase [Cyanothece sp. BG0011]